MGPIGKSLKGRDVRALREFRDRVAKALGPALHRLALLAVRPLALDPLALPGRAAGQPAAQRQLPPPPPPPPTELLVLVELARRDVLADAAIDEAAYLATRDHGAVIAAIAATPEELRRPEVRGGMFGRRLEAAEPIP